MISVKKISLCLVVMFLGAFSLASTARAAERASVGVEEIGGAPVLLLTGTGRADQLQVTRYSALPPGEDPIYGDEVPVYSVSEVLRGTTVSAGSSPGVCWEELETVYCRTAGIRGVVADLRGGDDSLLVARNLKLEAEGGPGSDSIYGGIKNDVLSGGSGRDYLQGEGGDDRLSGGAGPDTLIGDKWRDASFFKPYAKPAGRDRIDGGAGPDTIQGGAGADLLRGGSGDDWFENNRDRARDRIEGGAGRDSIRDPDVSRTGNGVAILDRIGSSEFVYLALRRYRLV